MKTGRHSNIIALTSLMPLIVLAAIFYFLPQQTSHAQANLNVEINTAYNLVVDSNVSSPSTYAPRVATVYGTFCNDGEQPLTNVYGNIGNYNGGTNPTPGVYPPRNSADAAFQAQHPWAADTGSYAFTHVGGATGMADATRYIGDLQPGECKVQYWHFTYPACANDAGGNPVEPPCNTTPTWGSSVKADDDLWLEFDIWSTGQQEAATYSDNARHRMTMRNEISAMANKIKPNPDGAWFNTDTATIVPGQVITTNGVLYTLGNIRQGFDNDGDFVPDYNAWLQPFGDPSYDPSCFRLIRTSTVLTVSRSAGQPNLILLTNDLNPHPVYGGPLYFTNLPPDNNGVRGEVRYTFLALSGPCSVPITPYQEVASGSDNEKFNGDYGTGIPTVQSSVPEVTISKSGSPSSVALNADITYSIPFANQSATYPAGLTLSSSGINMPLVIRDQVPVGLEYRADTAASGNTNPTGCSTDCFTIRYSTDGGTTWSLADPGNTLSTLANPVIIEWWLNDPLPTNGSGVVTFQARVPSNYLENSNPAFITNDACASFGGGVSFACDTDVTMVQGNNSLGDFVWADVDTNGLQNGGETGIPNITLWLYWDANGDGLLDNDDLLIATTSTDTNGAYSFTQLPIGDYIVAVDGFDPDTPVGYNHTTPKTQAVIIAANNTSYTDADFGFGPILDLTKSLTNGQYDGAGYDNLYEGQLANYQINVINTRPGGTGPNNSCQYTVWAGSASGSGPANSQWQNMLASTGSPDNAFAYTVMANNDDTILLSDFFIGEQTGENITNVSYVLFLKELVDFDDDQVVVTIDQGATEVGTGTFNFAYFNQPVGYVYEATIDLGTGLDWADFDPNAVNPLVVTVLGDRIGGVGGEIAMDAAGFIITTDGVCGDPGDTLNPVPVTDTYNPAELEFVSANPPVSSQTPAGTLTWNNVGPLEAGETESIGVVFRVLATGGVVNNAAGSSGAQYLDGRLANEADDNVNADILPAHTIGDYVWFDADGAGDQDPGERGLASVVLELRYTGNSTIFYNGRTYGQNSVIATTTTNANGAYLFTGIPGTGANSDDFAVHVIEASSPILNGLSLTTGSTDPRLINNLGGDVLTADFGYNSAGSMVYGSIWNDRDADADTPAVDTNEPYIAVVTVQLCADTAGTNCVATTTTDENGAYQFTNVPNGTYYVVVTPPGTQVSEPTGENATQVCGTCINASPAIVVNNAVDKIYGGYDFGYTGANIGDTIYIDWDGDGTQEAGENGISGVDVYLYSDINGNGEVDAEDILLATDTTNANGEYLFTGYPAGNYLIIVDSSDLPTGYVQIGDPDVTIDDQHAISTDGVNNELDVDFGYQPQGSATIGDYVWGDLNRNTAQDASENGLPNIDVNLYVDDGDGIFEPGTDDALVASVSTDSDGLYEFSYVYANGTVDYWVQVDEADGDLPISGGTPYVLTTDNNPTAVTNLPVGGSYLDADFGFAPGGIIGDTIYWDANGNAEQDWNEVGIPGVDVTLEVWNGSAWVTYATDTTDSEGNYLFTGLPAGDYRVVVDTGAGSPIENNDLTGDPDTNGIPCFPNPGAPWTSFCDSMQEVEINPGQTYLGADFGYQPTGVIGDFVWLDGDEDGVQDAGEPGLADLTVYLCNTTPCASGNAIETTTTDYEGYYSFINVGAGTWYVAVDESTLPTGLTPTYDLDSGTTNPDGETAVTLANAGDSNLDADFGYRLNGSYSISGTVYYDLNENGGDHVDEPGYENQPIYLWQLVGGSYVLVGTTTTDATGNYTIPNLPNGTYVVSTEATSLNLNNAAHTTRLNENDATAWEEVTIADANVEDVDFGFFLPTDFDDLPNSYQTQLSGGAYHIISGTLRLGTGIDLEPNGLPGGSANNDSFDDGVVRAPDSLWQPGNTVQLTVTVSGGMGVVGAWFDWNNDGDFTDPDEFISFGALAAGSHAVSLTIPASYTTGQQLYTRFRVFDPANVPGGSLTAVDYQGGANGGEVEGYYWMFSPTAVSLATFSASRQHPALLLSAAGVLAMLLLSAVVVLRQRRPA